MEGQDKAAPQECPEWLAQLEQQAREAFEAALYFCRTAEGISFWQFERSLQALVARLGCCLVRLFLAYCHRRLDVRPYLEQGYRQQDSFAPRKLQTAYGEVTYGRRYLVPQRGPGGGCHPLDIVLGLTRDKFSPWVIEFVTRLSTRLSYQGAQLVCRYALSWSPSTESIEHLVLGLGRHAAPYMVAAPAPEEEGEVLVIETDGKCTPTATAAELKKRRGPRCRSKDCSCGCQRHRGQQRRKQRGKRKRRKKGDKSKNGREVMLVVMYTLRRGPDGKLHGPINKQVWGSYAGRLAAAHWARAQATKRGFPPGTSKVVQIVTDGAKGLKENLEPLFPDAIFTLDVRHVEEKLWRAGRAFHAEGSEELAAWVGQLQELLYRGQAAKLVEHLQQQLNRVSLHGPGTRRQRTALEKVITYLNKRLEMMRYAEWQAEDLVLASGQVEGAVRHVVGQRMDGSGMRWIPERAEALLHLRCIELNGDWEAFFAWAYKRYREQLEARQPVQIRTQQLLQLATAL